MQQEAPLLFLLPLPLQLMLRFDGVHPLSPVAVMILATICSLYLLLNGVIFSVDSSILMLLGEHVMLQ